MRESKPIILIVEDEFLMRNALAKKFESANFKVLKAADGVSALDIALKNHPDIILLDILLPKMNGLETLKKLRRDDWGKKVPVILLTNVSDTAKVAEGMKSGLAGSYEYLIKTDWSLDEVVKKAQDRLRRK